MGVSRDKKDLDKLDDPLLYQKEATSYGTVGISNGRTRKPLYCMCLILFGISIPYLFLVVALIALNTILLSFSHLHSNNLAIASDVIDCDPRIRPWFYSGVKITEVASDELNDNKNGIPIDVFSVRETEIKRHNFTDAHRDFEYDLFHTGINRFIIPYNYFNRPWYLRRGSNITVEFGLNYTVSLDRALLYVLKGENTVSNFLDNDKYEPHYEHKIDISKLIHRSEPLAIEIESSGYHYVVAHIVGTRETRFICNITFDVVYIDADDYDTRDADKLAGIGNWTVVPMDKRDGNSTLCHVHSIDPNELESPSVHLDIEYLPNVALQVPLFVAPFALTMVYAVVVLLVYRRRLKTHSSLYRRKQYLPINH